MIYDFNESLFDRQMAYNHIIWTTFYLYDTFMVHLHPFLKVSKLQSTFIVIWKRATRALFKFLLSP